jgi:DHA2 family multidrug resistance protein
MGNATSIYNLMRNIGGSFGIATMTTFLARRQQVHQNQLIGHITKTDPRTRQVLYGLQSFFHQHGASYPDAMRKSLGAVYAMVQQQAAMLSFVEAFWVMAIVFWAMIPLLFLLRNARDLHPHARTTSRKAPARELPSIEEMHPEPELVGFAD